MNKSKEQRSATIEKLLEYACPSIAMRVRKELLEEHLSQAEKKWYLSLIMERPGVKRVLAWQKESGYLGDRFHTADSKTKIWPMEACFRYLLEMGVPSEHEVIQKAQRALQQPGWGKECEQSIAAETFGYRDIRAGLFAQSGTEQTEDYKQRIEKALQAFRNIVGANCVDDLILPCKEKLVFKENIELPNLYHQRLLAYDHSWRTQEHMEMIRQAYRKLYQWLPLPPIYLLAKGRSYMVAPGATVAQAFNRDYVPGSAHLIYEWIQFYELSARMGVIDEQSPFLPHFCSFADALRTEDGWHEVKAAPKYFIEWGAYSGIALEDNWRMREHRRYDLTFRILLIDQLITGNC